MLSLLNRFRKPTIPLLILNSHLNHQIAANLLAKLQKINFHRSHALALAIDINNYMPVQADNILAFLKHMSQLYRLPIYGFCHEQVSYEAYYLLSIADQIYTMPSTVFTLHNHSCSNTIQPQPNNIFQQLSITKQTIKSHQQLSSNMSNMSHILIPTYFSSATFNSPQLIKVHKSLFQQSLQNRLQKHPKPITPINHFFIGHQAINNNYVDSFGTYSSILLHKHPNCLIQPVQLRQKIQTKHWQLVLASPIIIILFMFKVFLKYSLIMFLYMRHQQNRN